MSIRYVVFVFLFVQVMSGRLAGIIRIYAAIPVQLEIVVHQYISWCVPIVWTLVLFLPWRVLDDLLLTS